jgi:diguanylate cyclase (GGDEF)-like protein
MTDRSTSSLTDEVATVVDALAAGGEAHVAVAHLLGLRRLVCDDADVMDGIDALIVDVVRAAIATARQTAMVDPLTHLGTRAALDLELPSALARSQRSHRDVTVVFFDLGRGRDDTALVAFAAALADAKRTGDGAYRVGADEFVAVLADAEREAADVFIKRIEAADPPRFSWGVASAGPDGFNAARLVRLADVRMLQRRYLRDR